MKRLVFGGIVILSLSGLVLSQGPGRGRGDAEPQPRVQMTTAPSIAFDSVPDFLKLPEGMNFGEVPGVAVNSTRCPPRSTTTFTATPIFTASSAYV